jgi:hypothetical protein
MAYRPASSASSGGFTRWLIRILLLILIVPPVALALWTWGTMHYSYASGERIGYVQKLSKKGWLCKSWEGEMSMANFPGAAQQLFNFSVVDDSVVQAIRGAEGKRVSLSYVQHKHVPTNCFAETEYYVTQVQVLDK